MPGKSRCATHHAEALKAGQVNVGTTPAWRKARTEALRRAKHRCSTCGLTDTASRAAGLGGLHIHHLDGRGVRAKEHDQELLEVRCQPCHTDLVRRGTRKTLEEHKAELRKGFSP